jgi:hypothetical protein
MFDWKCHRIGRVKHAWTFKKDKNLVSQCKVCLKEIQITTSFKASGVKHANLEEAEKLLGANENLVRCAEKESIRPIVCNNCYSTIAQNPSKALYMMLFADMDQMATFCTFLSLAALFCSYLLINMPCFSFNLLSCFFCPFSTYWLQILSMHSSY